MAYPRYIGKTAFTSGTGALTVAALTGTRAGDIIILFVESANESISGAIAGYSALATQVGTGTAGAAGGVRIATFYRILGDEADTTTSVNDSGDHTTAIKMLFRDTSLADGAFFVTATSTQAATTAMVFPSVTTATDESLVVLAVGQDTDAASTATVGAVTNANLANITERHDQTVASGQGGGLAVITGEKATAGSTGTSTATGSTSVTHAYHTISLSRVAAQTTTSAFNAARNTVYFPISDAMRITAGSLGSITATSSGTFEPNNLGTDATYAVNFKWYWRQYGTDAWTTSAAVAQTTSAVVSGGVLTTTGSFTDNETITGLTNGVEYELVLFAARTSATPTMSVVFSATATVALTQAVIIADSGTYAYTGTAANTLFNRKAAADQGSFALAGTDATFSIGAAPNNYSITADPVAFALTGTAANLNDNRVLTAETVNFALSGEAAGLVRSYVMPIDPGAYGFTGTDAVLNRGYSITADTVSFGFTGAAASLLKSSVIPAESASFDLTETAANLNFGRFMVGDSGAYALTGTANTLAVGRNMAADAASYALTGTAVNLTYTPTAGGLTMPADTGSFALTGASAGIFVGRVLSADGGSFAVTGQVAGLVYTRNLVAASGSFAITGTDATLTKGVVTVDYVLPVDSGAYNQTAPAAAFRRTYVVQADPALIAWQGAEVLLERYIPRYSRGNDSTGQASFRASPQATIRAAAAGMTRKPNSGFRRNGPKANHRPG